MTPAHEKPDRGGAAGLENASLPGGIDYPSNAPKTAPVQADFLLDAIKALAAEEIRADTLENVQRRLIASGWRSTIALLTHAIRCVDAGDYLNAERNRQSSRQQFIVANDAWRQFMEARGTEAVSLYTAQAFR